MSDQAHADSIQLAPIEATSEVETQEAGTESSTSTEVNSASSAEKAQASEALKSLKKEFNIKVDGKEIKREIDLMNDAEITKLIQLAEMSGKRANEASELRKKDSFRDQKVQELLQGLDADPFEIMKSMGKNVDELVDAYTQKKINEKMMSPEQRELQALQAKLQEVERREKEAMTRAQREAESRQLEEFRNGYKAELDNAFQDSGLVRNPETISMMMRYMNAAIKEGVQISFSDLVPVVKEDIQDNFKAYIQHIPEDVLEQLLKSEKIDGFLKKKSLKAPAKKAPPTSNTVKNSNAYNEVFGNKVKERTIDQNKFFDSI